MIVVFVYLFITVLLLWHISGVKGFWSIKVLFIIVAGLASLMIWYELLQRAGWPTQDKPPAGSIFISGLVDEPNNATGDRGQIYLWLFTPNSNTPRGYKLPYSRQLHKEVSNAQHEAKKGSQEQIGYAAQSAGSMHLYKEPPTNPYPKFTG